MAGKPGMLAALGKNADTIRAHGTGTTVEQQTLSSEEDKKAQMDRFYQQQGEVQSLTHAEEARTLIQINTCEHLPSFSTGIFELNT